jgi:hypothetical protein
MNYDEIVQKCEELSYREKFRLAQLLIQLGRKEEEEEYPVERQEESGAINEQLEYVTERILKLKPSKKKTLLNSIGAMFQFQGAISEKDKEEIIRKLQKRQIISIAETGRVTYHE